MTCIQCDANTNDCTCPDIEDRLREIIRTGNGLARHWARLALENRLRKKYRLKELPDEIGAEINRILAWPRREQLARNARLN